MNSQLVFPTDPCKVLIVDQSMSIRPCGGIERADQTKLFECVGDPHVERVSIVPARREQNPVAHIAPRHAVLTIDVRLHQVLDVPTAFISPLASNSFSVRSYAVATIEQETEGVETVPLLEPSQCTDSNSRTPCHWIKPEDRFVWADRSIPRSKFRIHFPRSNVVTHPFTDSRVRLRVRTWTGFRTRGTVGLLSDAGANGRGVADHSARRSSGERVAG